MTKVTTPVQAFEDYFKKGGFQYSKSNKDNAYTWFQAGWVASIQAERATRRRNGRQGEGNADRAARQKLGLMKTEWLNLPLSVRNKIIKAMSDELLEDTSDDNDDFGRAVY